MMSESVNYILRLRKRWFNAIQNGSKTIEGRLYRNQCQIMKPGDTITFINKKFSEDEEPDKITIVIESLIIVDSFTELYSLYGDSLLPRECLTNEELKNPSIVYENINDYKSAVENEVKVLGIRIGLI
jgi:ASC-1-like (ASCH) protein